MKPRSLNGKENNLGWKVVQRNEERGPFADLEFEEEDEPE